MKLSSKRNYALEIDSLSLFWKAYKFLHREWWNFNTLANFAVLSYTTMKKFKSLQNLYKMQIPNTIQPW